MTKTVLLAVSVPSSRWPRLLAPIAFGSPTRAREPCAW